MTAPMPRLSIAAFDDGENWTALLQLCAGIMTFTAEFLRMPFALQGGHDCELRMSGTAAAGLAGMLEAASQALWFKLAVDEPPEARSE
jgi:hypothetical protein